MFQVMLAKSEPATDETIRRLSSGDYYFDLKLDGLRGVLAVSNGRVSITNRNGVNITRKFPEIVAAALAQFGTDTQIILDGEVVCFVEDRPSFKHTAKRGKQEKPAMIEGLSTSMPASFVAFDILYHGGVDMRDKEYRTRKEYLDSILDSYSSKVIVGNVGSMDGAAMLNLVKQQQLEGLVAKRLDGQYKPGRRSEWVKIKPTQTISAIAWQASPGTGTRADTFGALVLCVLDEHGKRIPIGDVGTGFKRGDLAEIMQMFSEGKEPIVEVEFQEFTVDGRLRFPVYRGLRDDLIAADCTFSQIVQQPIEEMPV